ncbi:uncharacterized protein LTR77_008874 [Saxophila tyrrhenica]|uniref:Transposase MuDR plant domain-containing protein n=1 Tax=Saxophila tyrrhenica TaxID=1690608 RepID=A0AAV9P0H8_9PEZI|nr:hypothetical protein LTR77_008874 [Saxophila tyrrhenica]
MADKVSALRLQVNAAEFLLKSLQDQLKEAERQASLLQENNNLAGNALPQAGNGFIPPPTSGTGGDESTHRRSNVNHLPEGPSEDGAGGNTNVNVEPTGQTALQDDNALNDDEDAPHEDDDLFGLDDPTQEHRLPTLEVGTIYPSLESIKQAAVAHAISQGWTCGVDKRDRSRLLLKCRSDPSCPFHLRAEQYEDAARICSYKPEHSCNFQPDQSHVPRGHATHLRFLREQLPSFMTVDESTTAREVSDAIFQRFGTRRVRGAEEEAEARGGGVRDLWCGGS